MSLVLVMWIVWAVFVLLLAAMYIYRSFLTKNEEDQIFLDDSFNTEKAEQEAIIAGVAKVEPLMRVAKILVVAMSIVVIAYYLWDVFQQFHT